MTGLDNYAQMPYIYSFMKFLMLPLSYHISQNISQLRVLRGWMSIAWGGGVSLTLESASFCSNPYTIQTHFEFQITSQAKNLLSLV